MVGNYIILILLLLTATTSGQEFVINYRRRRRPSSLLLFCVAYIRMWVVATDWLSNKNNSGPTTTLRLLQWKFRASLTQLRSQAKFLPLSNSHTFHTLHIWLIRPYLFSCYLLLFIYLNLFNTNQHTCPVALCWKQVKIST